MVYNRSPPRLHKSLSKLQEQIGITNTVPLFGGQGSRATAPRARMMLHVASPEIVDHHTRLYAATFLAPRAPVPITRAMHNISNTYSAQWYVLYQ